jgi:hypothetical protein
VGVMGIVVSVSLTTPGGEAGRWLHASLVSTRSGKHRGGGFGFGG